MATTKPRTKKPVTKTIDVTATLTAEIETPNKISEESALVVQETAQGSEQTVVEVPENTTSVKKRKLPKAKVIRDSFSFPEQDYLKISELKKICLAEGIHVKKGEILRAGLGLLSGLTVEQLKQTVAQVERVKTGRPKA